MEPLWRLSKGAGIKIEMEPLRRLIKAHSDQRELWVKGKKYGALAVTDSGMKAEYFILHPS